MILMTIMRIIRDAEEDAGAAIKLISLLIENPTENQGRALSITLIRNHTRADALEDVRLAVSSRLAVLEILFQSLHEIFCCAIP